MPAQSQKEEQQPNAPASQQNGSTSSPCSSESDLDSWKHRAPYQIHRSADDFSTVWNGACHCGRTRYQLSRARPLSSKYCHCTTCQRLHGAPFQWAAIFHKTDINFTHGHHNLAWYDSGERTTRHKLPCKVSCSYCRAPIMDEGRNMILLFPTLVEGINTEEGREAFKVQAHMFYSRRVVEVRDGVAKWDGLDGKSRRMDDEGRFLDGEGIEGEGKEEEEKGEPESKRQKIEAGGQ